MMFYVHIAKTGGTAIKRAIRNHYGVSAQREPQIVADRIVLLNHVTLNEAIAKFGEPSAIAFAYRDPASRFVSGFYCRQRMGYPDHQARWDYREAAAFAHFETANDLAEALDTSDLTRRAAAYYAMDAIRHLRRGYVHQFGHLTNFLLDYSGRVNACIDTAHLTSRSAAFLTGIGISGSMVPPDEKADKPAFPRALSAPAQANLRKFWAAEYAYYDAFTMLEAELAKA